MFLAHFKRLKYLCLHFNLNYCFEMKFIDTLYRGEKLCWKINGTQQLDEKYICESIKTST